MATAARKARISAAALAVFALSRAAFATDPPSADAFFDSANAAYVAGDYASAAQLYAQAYAMRPSQKIAANWGLAELHLKRYAHAAELFDTALETENDPKARLKVSEKLTEAKQHLATLNVRASVEGCRVTLDGKELDPKLFRKDIYRDPGAHHAVAECPGYLRVEKNADVAGGDEKEIVLVPPKKPSNTGVYVAGAGITVAGVVAGIVFTALSNTKSSQRGTELDQLKKDSGSPNPCGANHPSGYDERCNNVSSLSTDANTWRGLAITSFIVGGAAALGTGAFVLHSKTADTEEQGVWFAPTFGGASFGGRF